MVRSAVPMSSPNRDSTRDQFERRMRARRAATCVRVARQAIAEGRLVDAEERLDEACRLDPDDAEAHLLLEELRAASVSDPAVGATPRERRPVGSGWSHWVAAAVAIVALAALAFFWPLEDRARRPDTPARRAPASSVIELPAAVQLRPEAPEGGATRDGGRTPDVPVATTGKGSAPLQASVSPKPKSNGPRRVPFTVPPPAAAEKPGPTERDAKAAAEYVAPPRVVLGPPPSVSAIEGGAPAPPATPPAARSVGTVAGAQGDSGPGRRVDPQATLLADVPVPQPDAALASMRPVPGPSDERLILDTLGHYADAYGRLDASAAKRVWPTVDAEALRRAFEGLQSQSLTFDRCDLQVNGVEAIAACRGRANFVPKIGSREPLAVSRLWTFTLRKGEAGWAIRSADAR